MIDCSIFTNDGTTCKLYKNHTIDTSQYSIVSPPLSCYKSSFFQLPKDVAIVAERNLCTHKPESNSIKADALECKNILTGYIDCEANPKCTFTFYEIPKDVNIPEERNFCTHDPSSNAIYSEV